MYISGSNIYQFEKKKSMAKFNNVLLKIQTQTVALIYEKKSVENQFNLEILISELSYRLRNISIKIS